MPLDEFSEKNAGEDNPGGASRNRAGDQHGGQQHAGRERGNETQAKESSQRAAEKTSGIQGGRRRRVVVGIVGAFIAGWLFPTIGLTLGGGVLANIIHATIGAVILLVLLKLVKQA